MSGDVPFGFGSPRDPDDSENVGQGSSGPIPPGFGNVPGMPGMPEGFDMASLGAALQQLGTMLQSGGADSEGPVNWKLANDVSRQKIAEAGDPSVGDSQKRAVEEAVNLADIWLDIAMQFPATSGGARAWSRSEWLEATMPAWQRFIAPIAEQLQSTMQTMLPSGDELGMGGLPEGLPPELAAMAGPLMGMARAMGSAMFGMQVGQGLAALAGDVVSAGDVGIPLTSDGHASLLPENIRAFSEGLDVADGDVLVFIALREAAHQRLFAHVPWLRARVEGALEAYAKGIRVDKDRIEGALAGVDMQNPEALQEALASGVFEPEDTPEQKAALARLETLLALVEGWVDDVVDAAVADRLPSYDRLRETLRRRRATGGPAEKTFATLVGLELRPRRLREAAQYWETLRTTKGVEGRDAMWAHPDLLPTGDDLEDVQAFLTASALTDFDASDFEGPGAAGEDGEASPSS